MITDVPGVRVGHWTAPGDGRTGCTVVLLPAGTVASGEVRGGAPGTREFALLAPERLVSRVDAVVLSGGSAFGLAACDGVMGWCEERGIGFPTPAGPVPIVVGMVLYDLLVGSSAVRPGAAEGRAACEAAAAGWFEVGAVGAGTGATVRKWTGDVADVRPGGVGSASVRSGDLVVGALFAVNAVGDVPDGAGAGGAARLPARPGGFTEQTTIGVVATNAALDKVGCLLVAQSAHDGLARALDPAHLSVDGDAVVSCAVGGVDAPLDHVRVLAALATEQSIRSALGS
ncbi:MAG TPA: P1 family peptidase [Acidimicrobiales bacterium]|nr:P1 family peptidase [Acidimicrobiales bacterium]